MDSPLDPFKINLKKRLRSISSNMAHHGCQSQDDNEYDLRFIPPQKTNDQGVALDQVALQLEISYLRKVQIYQDNELDLDQRGALSVDQASHHEDVDERVVLENRDNNHEDLDEREALLGNKGKHHDILDERKVLENQCNNHDILDEREVLENQCNNHDILDDKEVLENQCNNHDILDDKEVLENQCNNHDILDERKVLENQCNNHDILDDKEVLENQCNNHDILDERKVLENQDNNHDILDDKEVLENQCNNHDILDERKVLENHDNNHDILIQDQHNDIHQRNLQQGQQMVIVAVEPQHCNRTSCGERVINNNRHIHFGDLNNSPPWRTWARTFKRYWKVLVIISVIVIGAVLGVAFLVISRSNKKVNQDMERKGLYPQCNLSPPLQNETAAMDLYAHGNLSPPLQNETAVMVPEFPDKKIYIPLKKGELVSGIDILDDRVTITEPGMYFAYGSIIFRPNSVLHCKDFKRQKLELLIEGNSSGDLHIPNTPLAVTCSPETSGFNQTSYTGRLLHLESGDFIRISISGYGLGYFKSHASYFGLFKINTGAFAHVDLLPPLEPSLNDAVKGKVPEFPDKKIYIPLRKGDMVSGIDILDDRVTITEPGMYFVYGSINFRPDSVLHCKDFKRQNWELLIIVYSSGDLPISIIRLAVTCSPETAGFDQTSYTGCLLHLESGDFIRISISGYGLGYFKSHASYFGLFKINTGAFGHVDLLPPLEPSLNDAVKRKVPEFPDKKIYIPLRKGELVSGIDILEDRVTITEPGMYFVYGSINFRPDSVLHCKDFKSQNWYLLIEVFSSAGLPTVHIVVTVTCSPETADFNQTSSTGRLLHLETGDFIRISISGYGLGNFTSHASYFGLFKINPRQ